MKLTTWKLSGDLKNFKNITDGGIVVMGRKTWETLPNKFKPLPVASILLFQVEPEEMREMPEFQLPEIVVFSILDELFTCYLKNLTDKQVFIIGGGTIYNQIFTDYKKHIHTIYTTEVYNVPKTVEYTAFFPVKSFSEDFMRESVSEFKRESGDDYWYRFVNWTQDGGWQNLEELSYLSVLEQLSQLPNTEETVLL